MNNLVLELAAGYLEYLEKRPNTSFTTGTYSTYLNISVNARPFATPSQENAGFMTALAMHYESTSKK